MSAINADCLSASSNNRCFKRKTFVLIRGIFWFSGLFHLNSCEDLFHRKLASLISSADCMAYIWKASPLLYGFTCSSEVRGVNFVRWHFCSRFKRKLIVLLTGRRYFRNGPSLRVSGCSFHYVCESVKHLETGDKWNNLCSKFPPKKLLI